MDMGTSTVSAPPPPDEVKRIISTYSEPTKTDFMSLRELIYETTSELPEVESIEETLKWGEPAYLPVPNRIGTTIRLGWSPKTPEAIKLFVNCQTSLVSNWQETYGPALNYEGNRALVFGIGKPRPINIIKACINDALTYHLNKS